LKSFPNTLLLILCAAFCSCTALKTRSFPEKKWAVLHPIAAVKVYRLSKPCYQLYNQTLIRNQLDTFANGGQLDAFRHAFFMATFAQKIKIKQLRKLGNAHEKGNYLHFKKGILEDGELPDSISTVMDVFNNEIGFTIGTKNKSASLSALAELVISTIKNGELRIIKRNTNGNYLNCNGLLLRTNDLHFKWQNEKCLVSSNLYK
jgi:hypothetical protein